MRIIVMSDMHGRRSMFEKAIEAEPLATNVIFLGDGAEEAQELSSFYTGRNFYIVSGNCDMFSMLPTTTVENFSGTKILITHGHKYEVKKSTDKLLASAKQSECKIALYGHTHNASEEYVDGIYLFNPGCLCGSNGKSTYGAIDIEKNGILINTITL